MGEQTSPCSPRLSAYPTLGKTISELGTLGKTISGLGCPGRGNLWSVPGLASKKDVCAVESAELEQRSGKPLAASPGSHTRLPHDKSPHPFSQRLPPSPVLLPQMECLCCSRRFTNSCQPGLQHPESTKGRNLSHKINRLRVQVPQGDSRQSCLHTGLAFGEGSGGGRVGWECGEVQVPVALALIPGHAVGHTVSAGCSCTL